jgi:hypothetical protein
MVGTSPDDYSVLLVQRSVLGWHVASDEKPDAVVGRYAAEEWAGDIFSPLAHQFLEPGEAYGSYRSDDEKMDWEHDGGGAERVGDWTGQGWIPTQVLVFTFSSFSMGVFLRAHHYYYYYYYYCVCSSPG